MIQNNQNQVNTYLETTSRIFQFGIGTLNSLIVQQKLLIVMQCVPILKSFLQLKLQK